MPVTKNFFFASSSDYSGSFGATPTGANGATPTGSISATLPVQTAPPVMSGF